MTRWAILGSQNDSFVVQSESLVKKWGVYTTRHSNGLVSFALKYASSDAKGLIQISKWQNTKDPKSKIRFDKFAFDSFANDIDLYPPDFTVDSSGWIEKIEAFTGVKRFERVRRAIFYCPVKQLPTVFNNHLAPAFFRWYPDGEILLALGRVNLQRAMATLRVMGAAQELAGGDYEKLKQIGPLRMLSNVQSGGTLHLSRFINIPLAQFLPRMVGFEADKVVGAFVFLFDKPIGEVREVYPRSGLEFFRSGASTLFTEDIKAQAKDLTPEMVDRFDLIKKSFSKADIREFIQDYLMRLDGFLSYTLDPSNFVNSQTGYWAGLSQYRVWLTIERITDEIILMLTEDTPYLRKAASFRVLDQMTSLKVDGHSDQTKLFKKLLLPDNSSDVVMEGLKSYKNSIAAHFCELLLALRQDSKASVLEHIFVPGTHDKILHLVKLSNGKTVSEDEYVTDVIRELRNTYHGYLGDKSRIYLAINTGNLPENFPFLALAAFFAMIAKPELFLADHWE
jgi:hypothetical protein